MPKKISANHGVMIEALTDCIAAMALAPSVSESPRITVNDQA